MIFIDCIISIDKKLIYIFYFIQIIKRLYNTCFLRKKIDL